MYRDAISKLDNSCVFLFLITGLLSTAPVVHAETWLEEGSREFEELRLRQLQTVQQQNPVAAFSSDGCSGHQSQTWTYLAEKLPAFAREFGNRPPWESCCVTHDKAYWKGNAVDGYIQRKQADIQLRQCVIETGNRLAPQLARKYVTTEQNIQQAFSITAELMYKAVRIGGQPCSLLPWRWGYGWPNCAFASPNTVAETVSDIRRDEQLVFFNTTAWLDKDSTHWNIPIHGWIYEPQNSTVRRDIIAAVLESHFDLKVTPLTAQNFNRRINLLIAESEEDHRVVIRIAGQDITLPVSAEDGHISTTLKIPRQEVDAFALNGHVQFIAVMQKGDNRQYLGEVQLVPAKGISIISDIDDTIKITNVTDHKKLFDNTFFRDFSPVSGMPDIYRQLTEHNAVIHFVSSSPWQLYKPLQEFISQAGFPWSSMELKYIRFRDRTFFNLFKSGAETKPAQIEPILQHYPQHQFILIGDSGEQDPEVYGDIARRYPAQIKRILIHNVDNSSAADARYQLAFKDVDRASWQLFRKAGEIRLDRIKLVKK